MKFSIKRVVQAVLLYGSLTLIAGAIICQQQAIKDMKTALRIHTIAINNSILVILDIAHRLDLRDRYNVPRKYFNDIWAACEEHNLDVEFMIKLMYIESHYNPNAVSSARAYGLMQLQYPTARDIDSTLTSYRELFEPERNIKIGVAYFRQMLDRYDGDYRLAAIAYNRGPNRLDKELARGRTVDWYHEKIESVGITG